MGPGAREHEPRGAPPKGPNEAAYRVERRVPLPSCERLDFLRLERPTENDNLIEATSKIVVVSCVAEGQWISRDNRTSFPVLFGIQFAVDVQEARVALDDGGDVIPLSHLDHRLAEKIQDIATRIVSLLEVNHQRRRAFPRCPVAGDPGWAKEVRASAGGALPPQ